VQPAVLLGQDGRGPVVALLRPSGLERVRSQFGQTMAAEDIADAVGSIVTRPPEVTINEILIRPTEQER
jgi:NADP-dependent 3-hydroxy acid dehydrogenase YdfG